MVQHCPQRIKPLICYSKRMNVRVLGGLCLGEGLRHGVAVFRIKKVYMHGQAQILSQVSHALFTVNVISFRVVIRIHI